MCVYSATFTGNNINFFNRYRRVNVPPADSKCGCPGDGTWRRVPAQASRRQDCISRQASRRSAPHFPACSAAAFLPRIGCCVWLPRPAVRRGSLWGRHGAVAVRAAGAGAGGGRAGSHPVGEWVTGLVPWRGLRCVSTGAWGSRGLGGGLCGGSGGWWGAAVALAEGTA